ncbi:hypothetical protein SO802_012502 [Lithocarpus litseifolius]|uniref:Reverse transcriptase zinc-binding domain-containing protein n=1 Tax=Lithocarpus litseifolius TaxID=425828 RepID=A0AAW2D8D1_9ROSI
MKLKEGKWWIGRGSDIPQLTNLCDNNFSGTAPRTVADLINHSTGAWKPDLLRSLYPHHVYKEIFSLPISKTGCFNDKLLWKHSSFGDFQVHKAYSLLLKDFQVSYPNSGPRVSIPQEVWRLIWRVKLTLKIDTFVWKLLHDSLPTFLNLNSRRINVYRDCPLCNIKVESSTHLFLSCQFARAIWHGSALSIHTSTLNNISVQVLMLIRLGTDKVMWCFAISEAVLQALLLGHYMKLWWKPLSRQGPLVFSKFWYSATAGN